MSIQIVSTDEQYRKYPGIDRDEVLKIMEWFTKQPHLPNVTGTFSGFLYELSHVLLLYFIGRWGKNTWYDDNDKEVMRWYATHCRTADNHYSYALFSNRANLYHSLQSSPRSWVESGTEMTSILPNGCGIENVCPWKASICFTAVQKYCYCQQWDHITCNSPETHFLEVEKTNILSNCGFCNENTRSISCFHQITRIPNKTRWFCSYLIDKLLWVIIIYKMQRCP